MKHSEIRQQIVSTASQLFYSNGYNLTGINEIIDKAGIAKATLYNHFASKEDICLAYLQHKNNTFRTDIAAFCKSKTAGRDQILALFDYLLSFFGENDFNGCWCIKTVSEIPKDNEKIRAEIKTQKESLITFISSLVAENLPHMEESESLALSRKIYLLYESAVAESHLHQSDWPIREMKSLCTQIIA